jgi:ribokinase
MVERLTVTDAAAPAPVVVVGSLNMDLVLPVPRFPEPGETLSGGALRLVPGGKGANQAVACARLGAPAALVGLVGADNFGSELLAALQRDPIDLRHVDTTAQAATGVAMIMVDAAAQNRIALAPGANAALTPAHIDAAGALIDRAALLIVQLEIPLATVLHAIERAARAGRPIMLNPAPAQLLPSALWPAIDYLVVNETEAGLLAGSAVTDPQSAASAALALRQRGARQVLVTLGAQGVVIADAAGTRHCAAPAVLAVDTTAAGDTFIGGVAAGLSEGLSLDCAVQLGMAAAALCVTRVGAQSSIPYRAELATVP